MSSYNEPSLIKLMKHLYRWYRRSSSDDFMRAQENYKNDSVISTKMVEFPLDKDSIIIDIGGYDGNWSHVINSMYHPKIYIFEPVKKYFEILKRQFKSKKIKVFNFGISNETRETEINLRGAGSSLYFKSNNKEKIMLVDIKEIFDKNNLKKVDLLKINCEGEEYKILKRMIESDLIKRCGIILISFHMINKNSPEERKEIRKKLIKTHNLVFDYHFVLECWTKKTQSPRNL